jgi:hypothetical protein
MATRKIPFSEGDVLVNQSGSVTVEIDSIDGETVHCDDSRWNDTQEYDLDRMVDGVGEDGFTVISDSDLTDIKGIGESTAPEIEAKTGCATPDELCAEYLQWDAETVRGAIRRPDYLDEYILENIRDLDVYITLAQTKVLLFIREHGVNKKHSSMRNIGEISSRYHGVDKDKVTIEHIDWDDDALWMDSANVASMSVRAERMEEHNASIPVDELETTETVEDDGNYYVFTHASGEETWVTGDYVDTILRLFDVGLEDARVHPDGEYPVLFEDSETTLAAFIAPRVQPP